MTLRLCLALLLLTCLLFFVDVRELVHLLRHSEPLYLALMLALTPAMVWTSCWKWRLFIPRLGHQVSMGHLMRLYMVGYFVNSFAPSYVGGDMARSVYLGRHLSSQGDAFIATFLERFTGLLAMSLLGVTFLVLGAPATAGVSAAILTVATGTFFLATVCFSETVAQICFRLGKRLTAFVAPRITRPLEVLERIDEGLKQARQDQLLLGKALLLSLCFHCLTVLNTYFAARAIGWADPSIGGLFVIVPLVLLLSMVPLTPSGIGVQEGAFLWFLQHIGGTQAQGLGVGLILRAKIVLLGIIGGLLWLQLRNPGPGLDCDRSRNAVT